MIRGRNRTTRRRQPQWLIAFVAALYVLALALVGLHEATHGHRVCEHGELVHVDGGGHAGAHHSERSNAGDLHAGDALPSSTSSDHGHEHCTIALTVTDEQRVSTRLVACVVEPARGIVELRDASRVPSSEPLFLLAPHHSPPVV